jgi:hypothetical protein
MNPTEIREVETDERFPSGPWTGFFVQPILPGRHQMDMILTFREGLIVGEGRDRVGDFVFKGRYQVEDGKCWWTKTYIRKHSLAYQGFNEGKGIWGTWEYSPTNKGGFHIWPVAMGDPTQAHLAEAIEEPTGLSIVTPAEPILAPGLTEEVAEPVSGGPLSETLSATRGR